MNETITYSAARNPKWLDSAQTRVVLEVNFDHEPDEWVEFLTQASGDYPHTHELHARAIAGDFGAIATYENTVPPLTGDEAVEHIRQVRNAMLMETDHWALSDTPAMTQAQTDYRQALRDLPSTVSDDVSVGYSDTDGYTIYNNLTWPTKP